MSPFPARIVVDNTVLSTLQEARALSRILGYWSGQWLVPIEVMGEAATWKAHGANVVAALRDLETRGVLEITALNPQVEGATFSQLQRTLGQGESAAIAIAFHRQLLVCLDDRRARRACERLSPAVSWLSTEDVIGQAVRDGHINRAMAEAIWLATGIRDPNRIIPPT